MTLLLAAASRLPIAQGPAWAEAPVRYGATQIQDAIALFDASQAAAEILRATCDVPLAFQPI